MKNKDIVKEIKTEEIPIKTATGETSLEIWVHCPYCGEYQDSTDELIEELTNGQLSSDNCHTGIVCDNEECGKTFLVTKITY